MVVAYIAMAKAADSGPGKYRRVLRWVVLFVLLCLGCVLASVASFVFLPTIEIHTRYALRSFNLSGYVGMVTFAVVYSPWKAFWVASSRGGLSALPPSHAQC